MKSSTRVRIRKASAALPSSEIMARIHLLRKKVRKRCHELINIRAQIAGFAAHSSQVMTGCEDISCLSSDMLANLAAQRVRLSTEAFLTLPGCYHWTTKTGKAIYCDRKRLGTPSYFLKARRSKSTLSKMMRMLRAYLSVAQVSRLIFEKHLLTTPLVSSM